MNWLAGRAAAGVCVIPLLALGAPANTDPLEEPPGARLLMPFKQGLMAALKAGLAQGPVQAIAACRLQAPEIAAALSTGDVRMGRASHKLRNPENAGPEWAQAVLHDYLAAENWPAPRTVGLANGREGYAEPIRVQALCLACHGEALAPEVLASISENYPEDRATGFSEGDLRGVFWVEYAADE